VKPNFRSSTGFYITRTGDALAFESQLERDALLTLDFEPGVRKIFVQPLQIEAYVPDCRITLASGRTNIAEIKYESELVEKWSQLYAKYSTADRYCLSEGFGFGFVTDASVYYPERHRVKVLKKVRFLGNGNGFDDQVQEQLTRDLETNGPMLLSLLASRIDAPLNYPQRVREICRLICSGAAYILKTPSLDLSDSVISDAGSYESASVCTRVIGFEEMKERIRTHPLQHLQDGLARIVA
jgi:hypothetical protein